MGLGMKGDWLLVMALRERGMREGGEEEEEEVHGELATWLLYRFRGFFDILVGWSVECWLAVY